MQQLPISQDQSSILSELRDLIQQVDETMRLLRDTTPDHVAVGTTPKEIVFKLDHIQLYHYQPQHKLAGTRPILISYALVNRPYMLDLHEKRSLIRNLIDLGFDVYLIDWGYPKRNDRWITFGDYVNMYIDACVDFILDHHRIDSLNLFGICQGGVLSLCYTALHQRKINTLITTVTPVDFHVDEGMLNAWLGDDAKATEIDPSLVVDAFGNVPGAFINLGFLMLKPFELGLQKYLNLLHTSDQSTQIANFLRLEKWIFDNPDQAGVAWQQYVEWFYMKNFLVQGKIILDDETVDLGKITVPILNIFAEQDHLVPPASSKVLKDHVGSDDYTIVSFPVGHVGIYVSSKVQKALPNLLSDWLLARI